MPNYDYRCACGHTWEQQLLIADRDKPLAEPCPKCGQTGVERYLPSTQGLNYSLNDRKKVPNSFNDVLKKIKAAHRGSTIQTK